jgi:ATP/maltotriose-dependent transcriptional regulator MalT
MGESTVPAVPIGGDGARRQPLGGEPNYWESGRLVLDAEIVAHLVAGRERGRVLEGLGERERGVLAQMAIGASNRAIARRMFLSGARLSAT